MIPYKLRDQKFNVFDWYRLNSTKKRKPPGGLFLRKRRLRKKFLKWFHPPFDIGKSIDWLIKHTPNARWDAVTRAMDVYKTSFQQPYTRKLVSLTKKVILNG